jgi:hypothetical protein
VLEDHANLTTRAGELFSDSAVSSWPPTCTLPWLGAQAG